jgi:hypothetical protein
MARLSTICSRRGHLIEKMCPLSNGLYLSQGNLYPHPTPDPPPANNRVAEWAKYRVSGWTCATC